MDSVKLSALKKDVKRKKVEKKPNEIKKNDIAKVPKNMDVVEIVLDKLFGTFHNVVLTSQDTFDKLEDGEAVDKLKYAWEEKDLKAVLTENFDFDDHKKYTLSFLTPSGWREGSRPLRGKAIKKHVNFDAYLDSTRNYVRNDDDKIFAVQITES